MECAVSDDRFDLLDGRKDQARKKAGSTSGVVLLLALGK
jgi:hypothetical protein